MPYDPSVEKGNSSYRNVIQISESIVSTLIEGSNTTPWADKRYAQIVYDISQSTATAATTSAIYDTISNVTETVSGLTYGTPTDSFTTSNNIYHTFEVDLDPTSGNATVELEGSIDGVKYFNLDILNRSHILSGDSNGVYALSYTGKTAYARINYLTGDSVATVKYFGGR
jgi:hypothetical protein